MNPFDILKNAQSFKDQFQKVQDGLKDLQATGSAGGNIVKVTINGQFQVQRVDLDPVAVDPRDVPMLQDLIVAATNEALKQAEDASAQLMGKMTGGMGGFPF